MRVVLADVEEVEGEDVVFGPDHESAFLLIQQECVVSRTVGQAIESHQVVRLEHFCKGNNNVIMHCRTCKPPPAVMTKLITAKMVHYNIQDWFVGYKKD